MNNDIVARLRVCTCVPHGEICREAADEIERLRKERDEARREACEYKARYEEERCYPLDPPDEGNIQREMRRISTERGWDCFTKEVQP